MQYGILEPSEVSDKIHFSFWQSHIWQKILLSSSQAQEVFYFWNANWNHILVEIRSIWLGQLGAFSLWVTQSQFSWDTENFFSALFMALREKWCLFYQIEPINHFDMDGICTWAQLKQQSVIYKNFLVPYTRYIDLSVSLGEIMAQMHEKGRYNIRLAEKRWVSVTSVDITHKNIDIWMSLLDETTARDHFSHNSRQYYTAFLQELHESWSGELLFAYYNDIVIAAMIVVYTPGYAVYYYGASTSDRELRKHMAPYLLQWTAIKEAKARNIPLYDFLGVADPEKKDDPLQSVTDFKEKFGWYRSRLPDKIFFSLSWKGRLFLIFRSLFRK